MNIYFTPVFVQISTDEIVSNFYNVVWVKINYQIKTEKQNKTKQRQNKTFEQKSAW